MGFLGKVKQFFDTGGLDSEIESANSFQWEDGTFPFTLVVTGHAAHDRVIKSVSFEFEEYESPSNDDDKRRRSRTRLTRRIDGPIAVPAGETIRIDSSIELPTSTGMSRMIGGAFDLLSSGSISFGKEDFTLRASIMVEGMSFGKSVSKRIRTAERGIIPS